MSECHILRVPQADNLSFIPPPPSISLLTTYRMHLFPGPWVPARKYVRGRPTPHDGVTSEVCVDTDLLFLTTLSIRALLLD